MEIQKKNLNYVFRIEASGLGEKLSREIIIDSNDSLASLAYMLLSSINALSHHMYKMNVRYNQELIFTCVLMKNMKEKYAEEFLAKDHFLWKFNLSEGDVIEMDYGYSVRWHFFIQLIERRIEDTKYEIPKVLDGKGFGIVEDVSIDVVGNLLSQRTLYDGIDYTKFVNDEERYSDHFKMLKLIYENMKE